MRLRHLLLPALLAASAHALGPHEVLLLVILGLLVAVGRYTGYRLTELIRFRELADAPRPSVPV